jgi:hypothetical protein
MQNPTSSMPGSGKEAAGLPEMEKELHKHLYIYVMEKHLQVNNYILM